MREKAERAVASHVERCPAYLSVRDCIRISWRAEIEEAGGAE